jgi:hypothetical protein
MLVARGDERRTASPQPFVKALQCALRGITQLSLVRHESTSIPISFLVRVEIPTLGRFQDQVRTQIRETQGIQRNLTYLPRIKAN